MEEQEALKMIISREEIKDLQPVAEGYKIFNNDWTANYGNNYCYADENGNVDEEA